VAPQLPRVLVGTSPFIAAGQFGARSRVYYERFYGKPSAVREVIEAAHRVGVRAVQCLPVGHVVEAVASMRRSGLEVEVWASLMPGLPRGGLDSLAPLEPRGIAVHGSVSDTMNRRAVEGQLKAIRELGCEAGVAAHSPGRVLRWLMREGVDVDFVLVPFNALSAFMDVPPDELCELIRELGVPAMAMKALAAGALSPEEALSFIARRPEISSVALGVASPEEAVETFTVALKVLGVS